MSFANGDIVSHRVLPWHGEVESTVRAQNKLDPHGPRIDRVMCRTDAALLEVGIFNAMTLWEPSQLRKEQA